MPSGPIAREAELSLSVSLPPMLLPIVEYQGFFSQYLQTLIPEWFPLAWVGNF